MPSFSDFSVLFIRTLFQSADFFCVFCYPLWLEFRFLASFLCGQMHEDGDWWESPTGAASRKGLALLHLTAPLSFVRLRASRFGWSVTHLIVVDNDSQDRKNFMKDGFVWKDIIIRKELQGRICLEGEFR